ncbi:hypothetical protein Rhal01_03396 [Rubritalea halochordaticola]|uniref:KTSC domain-containing protein n=1 Tax=Rubritalea halochordaticola TaxID=714537 RepID=A0ABP9V3V0_9BACT
MMLLEPNSDENVVIQQKSYDINSARSYDLKLVRNRYLFKDPLEVGVRIVTFPPDILYQGVDDGFQRFEFISGRKCRI